MHSPVSFEKKVLEKKIESGEILMGEKVMETSYNRYKVDKDSHSIVHESIPLFAST